MKKDRLGFLKKLILVITDFRTYPFLVKHEKFRNSLLYLIKLTLLISLCLTLYVMINFNNTLNFVVENYNDEIPQFELKDGELTVDEKLSERINNSSYLVINTDYSFDEYSKTKEYASLVKYDEVTIVNKDVISIEYVSADLKINFDEMYFDIDKQGLYEELLRLLNDKSDKIILSITLFIVLFISYFTIVLSKIIMLSLIISIISTFSGIHLNFRNYIKIAIYAYTLPLIFDALATLIVGSGKDYTYYATLMLTYVYIIYAVRAIKLDAFIMLFSGRKNAKHSTSEFEKELQKYNEQVGNDELINKKEDANKENNENDKDKKE